MSEHILSHYQAKTLLDGLKSSLAEVQVSLDLELTRVHLHIDSEGVQLNDHQTLSWYVVRTIANSPSSCYVIEGGEARAIQFYSEMTNRVYSLYPTPTTPSMLVSGIPMHRIKDTDPYRDTSEKINTIKPVVGQVLDTATGLGYTAIQAARVAENVTTIELDPTVLKVCRLNPWSRDLFDNPKINQLIGDSFDIVAGMEAARFTRVIHDPPVFSLAGDLYSGEFYRQLYRVMRNKGMLFHYIGDPESKSGRNITAGVIRRLEQAGFRQVIRVPKAFGVVARKLL